MISVSHVRVIFACVSVLSAVLMHATLAHGRFATAAIVIGAAQAGLAVWLLAGGPNGRPAGRRDGRRRLLRSAAALTMFVVALLAGVFERGASIPVWSGVTHAAFNIGLLAVFGGSLRPGRVPVATAIARAVRGPLQPDLDRYTRSVTVMWACFGAAQLTGSALLLVLAPLPVWSLFVNGLDLPLVLLLFAIEYTVRRLRFRDLPRLSAAQRKQALAASFSARGS